MKHSGGIVQSISGDWICEAAWLRFADRPIFLQTARAAAPAKQAWERAGRAGLLAGRGGGTHGDGAGLVDSAEDTLRTLHDPVYGYGWTFRPHDLVIGEVIVLTWELAARERTLGRALTLDELDQAYDGLFAQLAQGGRCRRVASEEPPVAKERWLASKQATIRRYRESAGEEAVSARVLAGYVVLEIGVRAQEAEDLVTARRFFEAARRMFQEAQAVEEGWALHALYTLAQDEADLPRARSIAGELLRHAEAAGDRAMLGLTLLDLAEVAGQGETKDDARVYLDRALQLFRELGDGEHTAQALIALAAIEQQAGRFDQAHVLLVEAQGVYQAARSALGVAAVEMAQARLFVEQGRVPQARKHYQAAQRGFEKAGAREAAAGVREILAELGWTHGNYVPGVIRG